MRAYYHKDFKKAYKKLPQKLKYQTNQRIALFLENPFLAILNNHALSARYEGCRSINITGDLRAIFRLLDNDLAYFIDIGTHSKLYR